MNIFTFDALMLCGVFFNHQTDENNSSLKQKQQLKLMTTSPVLSKKDVMVSTTANDPPRSSSPTDLCAIYHLRLTLLIHRCGIKMHPHRRLMDTSTL